MTENAGSVIFTVQRAGDSSAVVSVDYASANWTAMAGSDYTAINGTLMFAAGETNQTIAVPILNDGIVESTAGETFTVTLSNPTNALLGARTIANVRITDNDKGLQLELAIRELIARGEARRVLILCPAGLIKNWQNELRGCFRLEFEVLGVDFHDSSPGVWENKSRVIASIDTVKRPQRMERLLNAPRFDLVIVDEAHHVSRIRYGKKQQTTQNYRLMEALQGHTRDLLFLSATPHQGDNFQFWSLVNLLDNTLFDSPEAMISHRSLLNRVMVRRTKREVVDANGKALFVRRQVHTETFEPALREQRFYEQLTDYLRTGYEAAGVFRSGRTTSAQRAIGFVMTAFQKMMSSSPRAIKQALRRRLLVLLVREQIDVERKRRTNFEPELPAQIVRLQDEMRVLSREILLTSGTDISDADADAYIAQVRQRICRWTR